MRKNFGAKEMIYPMPVFIIGTYNADGISGKHHHNECIETIERSK